MKKQDSSLRIQPTIQLLSPIISHQSSMSTPSPSVEKQEPEHGTSNKGAVVVLDSKKTNIEMNHMKKPRLFKQYSRASLGSQKDRFNPLNIRLSEREQPESAMLLSPASNKIHPFQFQENEQRSRLNYLNKVYVPLFLIWNPICYFRLIASYHPQITLKVCICTLP